MSLLHIIPNPFRFQLPHPTIICLFLQLLLILCLLALESHAVTGVSPWCTLLWVSLGQNPQPPLPGEGANIERGIFLAT